MHDDATRIIESLRAELATAEARATQAEGRVADLEDRLRRAERESHALRGQQRLVQQRLDGFLANMPGIVWEHYFNPDPARGRDQYVNGNLETLLGYSAAEWIQPNFWFEIVHPEDRELAAASSQKIVEEGRGTASYRWLAKNGNTVWIATRITLIHEDDGTPIGMRGITLDITDLKKAESERNEARLREELLQAQQESLLALSMPLVPIGDDLLAMTLVGKLDELRASRVITTLLDGVSRFSAQVVILDVTGVPEVDSRTADALVRAARAVSLLGAEIVLTGIRPEVARTLVELGVNLGSIMIRSTLKSGMDYALQKVRQGGQVGQVGRGALT